MEYHVLVTTLHFQYFCHQFDPKREQNVPIERMKLEKHFILIIFIAKKFLTKNFLTNPTYTTFLEISKNLKTK